MARNTRKSMELVSEYIDRSRFLTKMVGSAVLLRLMADETLDSSTYRRLSTSARAIRDSSEYRPRKSSRDSSGQQYLFNDEDIAFLTGGQS